MSSVLGILCSARKYGNSELLLKSCLRGAQEAGIEISMLRLSDFDIRHCIGCLGCVFHEMGCDHQDDMVFLLETINRHDGIVISSPTYFLGVPGRVKTFQDRLTMLYWFSRCRSPWRQGRPFVLLGVGGRPGWNAFSMPTLASIGLVLGGTIQGLHYFHSAGPGEIMLDADAMAIARQSGRSILERREEREGKDACPICRNNLFRVDPAGQTVECVLCNVSGKIIDGSIVWPESPHAAGRWRENALLEFVKQWIIPTRERFRSINKEIRRRKMPFLDHAHSWSWIRR